MDTARTVTAEISLALPPARVQKAFLDPTLLQGWWGVERALVEPRAGGIYALAWEIGPTGIRYISTGIIRRFQPGRLLDVGDYLYFNPERPILGPLTLRIATNPTETGTRLQVSQGEYPAGDAHWEWYFRSVEAAWPAVLPRLKAYLEALD